MTAHDYVTRLMKQNFRLRKSLYENHLEYEDTVARLVDEKHSAFFDAFPIATALSVVTFLYGVVFGINYNRC